MEDDSYNATEYLRERAAIMEVDGGMKRHEAEFYAIVSTWRFCARTGYSSPDDHAYRILTPKFTGKEPREPGERTEDRSS